MLIEYTFFCLIQLTTCQRRQIEAFIVGGQVAKIEKYPYSVYMGSSCSKGSLVSHWRCGSSILNQWIVLTAAHCFDCSSHQDTIFSVGSSNIKGAFMTSGDRYIKHPNYLSSALSHDIALVKTKNPLPLSSRASRVALMRSPPYNEPAMVAGWGVMNEVTKEASNKLKYTNQNVLSRQDCVSLLRGMPKDCLCASNSRTVDSYASEGDSGSALVVRGYIQIGIVAFKKPQRSMSVTVYTDTGYFYDWIISASTALYCQ